MTENISGVILREKGKPIKIEQRYKDKYPYLDGYIKILNRLVDELKASENIDVEVNLVENETLESELLLDNRLNKEKIRSGIKVKAIVFYYSGLNGDILLEEFRDQRICYIELQPTLLINMIRIALHEFHHFLDPFTSHEWQTLLKGDMVYIDYEATIQAYVRMGLNEYYANLHAFSVCLDFFNKIFENTEDISLMEESLIGRTISYLHKLGDKLDEFIDTLRSGEFDNRSILNPKAETIHFLWSKFFHQIYYFLGGWKVCENGELDTTRIQKIWDDLIIEIENVKLHEMINLLDSFKNLMLADFETDIKDEIALRVDSLFSGYYRERLDLDFYSLL